MKSICVFCGSTNGSDPAFLEAARALGTQIAASGLTLVYGGASVGLMGAVADAALAGGARVVGVIPEHLLSSEVGHRRLTEMHVTASMHERKALMAELSDAFVALPGGFGTLEEIIEILTWSQLGLHGKPIGFLDVGGFFSPLLEYFSSLVEHGFVREANLGLYSASADPGELLGTLVGRSGARSVRGDDYLELT